MIFGRQVMLRPTARLLQGEYREKESELGSQAKGKFIRGKREGN